MLIARAISTAGMISERPARIIISSLARRESGAVSVGLNAVLVVNARGGCGESVCVHAASTRLPRIRSGSSISSVEAASITVARKLAAATLRRTVSMPA